MGFDAKEAESVIIAGKDKDGKAGIMGYVEGVGGPKTGFTPEAIRHRGQKKGFPHLTNQPLSNPLRPNPCISRVIKTTMEGPKNPQAIYHQVEWKDREGFETTKIIPIENKERMPGPYNHRRNG